MTKKKNVAHIDVRYVADLARIHLTEAESAKFQQELDAILAYADKLAELDVDHIDPTAHAFPRLNIMRADEEAASLPREAFLKNAPAVIDDIYLRVPAVIEDEEEI